MSKHLVLLLFFHSILHSVHGQLEMDTTIKDFNQDGVQDTLLSYYDGGTGFGGWTAILANGKTDAIYSLNTDGCFCEMKRVIPYPDELRKTENIAFWEALKTAILPKRHLEPDASLQWMIAGAFAHFELEDDPYFDLLVDPHPEWQKGNPTIPENYYIEVSTDTLIEMLKTLYEIPEWLDSTNAYGCVAYYTSNHKQMLNDTTFSKIDASGKYLLLKTSHGLVLQSEEAYKWLFVSDYSLTGAPEKLRWSSISWAKIVGDYVILRQSQPPNAADRIFIIHSASGKIGRLKEIVSAMYLEDLAPDAGIHIDGDLIQLNYGSKSIEFSLKNLGDALLDR